MSSFELKGKIVVITGATQGIGLACTLELASRGAFVVGSARSPEPAAQITADAERLGGEFTFVQADVSRWKDCKMVAEQALEKYGRIDVLVNNAGISRPHGRMDEIGEDDWRAVSGPTLEGTIAMTRYVLPAMIAQKDGAIIHIASAAAVAGLINMGAYCMAKASVLQHAKVVAVENYEKGIRANALIVGAVATEAMRRSMLSQGRKIHGEDWNFEEGRWPPLGANKTLSPEQVAKTVALLCLDESREITGSAIGVDRGFSAGSYSAAFLTLGATGRLPL